MSYTTIQGGAPAGSGSSIISPPNLNPTQPVGSFKTGLLSGTDLVINQGEDVGTLYVQSASGSNVSIASLTPGAFEGQRLIISCLAIGAGEIHFLESAGGPGQINSPIDSFGNAFSFTLAGNSAMLTYSFGDLTGSGAGWYVNSGAL